MIKSVDNLADDVGDDALSRRGSMSIAAATPDAAFPSARSPESSTVDTTPAASAWASASASTSTSALAAPFSSASASPSASASASATPHARGDVEVGQASTEQVAQAPPKVEVLFVRVRDASRLVSGRTAQGSTTGRSAHLRRGKRGPPTKMMLQQVNLSTMSHHGTHAIAAQPLSSRHALGHFSPQRARQSPWPGRRAFFGSSARLRSSARLLSGSGAARGAGVSAGVGGGAIAPPSGQTATTETAVASTPPRRTAQPGAASASGDGGGSVTSSVGSLSPSLVDISTPLAPPRPPPVFKLRGATVSRRFAQDTGRLVPGGRPHESCGCRCRL